MPAAEDEIEHARQQPEQQQHDHYQQRSLAPSNCDRAQAADGTGALPAILHVCVRGVEDNQ